MAEPKNTRESSYAKASEDKEDKQSLSSNEDKVAQAYENISRKLEKLRSGEKIDAEESDEPAASAESSGEPKEPDLEEWKGPGGEKRKEKREEDDDMELRKVNLKNLEQDESEDGSKESKESKVLDELEEEDDQDESKEEDKPKKKREPVEDDPLDEEDGKEESKESEGSKETEDEENNMEKSGSEHSESSVGSESQKTGESEETSSDESDSSESLKHRPSESSDLPVGKARFSESESEMETPLSKDQEPNSLDDLAQEDDYDIPNLKGSRQRAGDMEYNTPLQTETFAGSYRDKSSMENNDPNNFFSQHNQSKLPKRANKFHLLVLVVIGIAVIGFTVYILKGGFGAISINPEPSPSPSVSETPTPTPTPAPLPDRAQYKVRVLNGSGKTGLAKTVSDKLKELGYQIDKTGNATNSAFTQTIVRVKTEAESFIPQIVTDLAPEFDAAGNTSLKDADTVDIEIILGAR